MDGRIGEGKYKEVGKQSSISVGVRKREYNGSNVEEKRVTVVKSCWNAVTRHFCAPLCGAIFKRSKYNKLLYKFASLCSRNVYWYLKTFVECFKWYRCVRIFWILFIYFKYININYKHLKIGLNAKTSAIVTLNYSFTLFLT